MYTFIYLFLNLIHFSFFTHGWERLLWRFWVWTILETCKNRDLAMILLAHHTMMVHILCGCASVCISIYIYTYTYLHIHIHLHVYVICIYIHTNHVYVGLSQTRWIISELGSIVRKNHDTLCAEVQDSHGCFGQPCPVDAGWSWEAPLTWGINMNKRTCKIESSWTTLWATSNHRISWWFPIVPSISLQIVPSTPDLCIPGTPGWRGDRSPFCGHQWRSKWRGDEWWLWWVVDVSWCS